MPSEVRRVLAVAGFAALLCCPLQAQTPSAPPLGNAASFAVLGDSAVTNSGPTIVTGNLGVSPGNTINGFPPGVVKLGDTYKNDALAKAAHHDAGVAYDAITSQKTCISGPLGDKPLPNRVYCLFPSDLPKVLTLDAVGKPDAFWIFQLAGSLITLPDSSVLAINGTQPGNVFWQTSGSATLSKGSAFVGNLLAHDNITLSSGAKAFGRLLALTGTVTLDSNNVTLCSTCNAITLDPLTLPDGTVSAPYNQRISAIGGAAPYTFEVISGTLPEGLILTRDGVLAGTLSGAPKAFGTFPFIVAATDSQGCSGEREYTIRIPCQAISVINPTTASGTSCTPFAQLTFTETGAKGIATFSLTPGSKLPTGLTLSDAGVLSGTPAECGRFPITVEVSDDNGCAATGPPYNLIINCPAIVVTNPNISTGTAGTPFSQTFTQMGTLCAVKFSLDSGTLPRGLTLAESGELSGTPLRTGTFTITVKATDRTGAVGIGVRYRLVIGCQTIVVRNPVNTMGTINMAFSERFTERGAIGTTTFSESGPLPAGLPPDGSSSLPGGILAGTPTQSGSFPIRVTVTDANQCSGTSLIYPLVINPVPCALTLSPATLPSATLNVPYHEIITATGGNGLYTFSVPLGVLPPGLTLAADGNLLGTPTVIGTYFFCITATDTNGCTGTQCYTLTVAVGGPTLSGWGMVVLSILLVGAALAMIRSGEA
jgi:hypothetical protein